MITTPTKELKYLQINLQHCVAASALLAQIVLELNIDIIFAQEPIRVLAGSAEVQIHWPNYRINPGRVPTVKGSDIKGMIIANEQTMMRMK